MARTFRRIFAFFAITVLAGGALFFYGGYRMAADPDADDDPMTQTIPERLAHRDAYYEECLDGSAAAPDELYCKSVSNRTISYFTEAGMIQEVLHYGTHGLVPRAYNEPTELERAKARREAEAFAQSNGADGSTRFTGAELEEAIAEEERLTQIWMEELGIADQVEAMQEAQP